MREGWTVRRFFFYATCRRDIRSSWSRMPSSRHRRP